MEPTRDVLFEHDGERFEWDANKAALNVANHGVTFEEAATAFADPYQVSDSDEAHSGEEGPIAAHRSEPCWTPLADSMDVARR